jgi:hypothetical protein
LERNISSLPLMLREQSQSLRRNIFDTKSSSRNVPVFRLHRRTADRKDKAHQTSMTFIVKDPSAYYVLRLCLRFAGNLLIMYTSNISQVYWLLGTDPSFPISNPRTNRRL